jgi:hypothetical protein
MQRPPDRTILDWIMDLVAERGAGLRDLTADEAEKLIRDSGLTEAQQAVLLSRDPVRIRDVIEYELGYHVEEYMMHTSTTPIQFVLTFPMHL